MLEKNILGFETFRKNPKEYILKVRNLCWMNDVPACYEEKEDSYRLSILEPKFNIGCMIDSSFDIPFILDGDNFLDTVKDCPTIEEAFIRFWNVQRIIDNKETYSLDKVYNTNAFKECFDSLKFEVEDREINWYESIDFHKAKLRSETKKVLIKTIEKLEKIDSDIVQEYSKNV